MTSPDLRMQRNRYALHPVFRALACVMGPLLILAGIAMPLLLVVEVKEQGWEGVWEFLPYAILMTFGVPLGIVMIRAARSGLDPLVGVFRILIPARPGREDPAALSRGLRVFA